MSVVIFCSYFRQPAKYLKCQDTCRNCLSTNNMSNFLKLPEVSGIKSMEIYVASHHESLITAKHLLCLHLSSFVLVTVIMSKVTVSVLSLDNTNTNNNWPLGKIFSSHFLSCSITTPSAQAIRRSDVITGKCCLMHFGFRNRQI